MEIIVKNEKVNLDTFLYFDFDEASYLVFKLPNGDPNQLFIAKILDDKKVVKIKDEIDWSNEWRKLKEIFEKLILESISGSVLLVEIADHQEINGLEVPFFKEFNVDDKTLSELERLSKIHSINSMEEEKITDEKSLTNEDFEVDKNHNVKIIKRDIESKDNPFEDETEEEPEQEMLVEAMDEDELEQQVPVEDETEEEPEQEMLVEAMDEEELEQQVPVEGETVEELEPEETNKSLETPLGITKTTVYSSEFTSELDRNVETFQSLLNCLNNETYNCDDDLLKDKKIEELMLKIEENDALLAKVKNITYR